MTTLPLADARANLSKLIEEASATHARFEITRNGRRTAVLLSADDFDVMQETIDVLADSQLIEAHRLGLEAIGGGDFLDADQLSDTLRAAGRLDE